jgi:hypothetical protein
VSIGLGHWTKACRHRQQNARSPQILRGVDLVATASHTQLIDAAARKYLRPLGCTQKGRSRTWLLDRGWFVAVVEFQPSSFAKGSFLNVGAHFLWTWNDHLSFDFGCRVEDFIPFVSEVQFSYAAERLASRAVENLHRLDTKLPTPGAVAIALADSSERDTWGRYHCAVAHGLAGESDRAESLLAELSSLSGGPEWQREMARRSAVLLKALRDRAEFADAVWSLVAEHRSKLRLPAVQIVIEQAS